MKVKFKKTFLKDLENLPEDMKKQIEKIVYIDIPEINNFTDIKNRKKIKSYKNYYRIKLGNYRIGFEFREGIKVFYRVLHRKDIFRYFPGK